MKTMATTVELLNRMEILIKELGNTQTKSCTCKSSMITVTDTQRDIVVNKTLSVTQRVILLFMREVNKETKQFEISTQLGISMKCTRENCEILMKQNYLKRGTIASTWDLV